MRYKVRLTDTNDAGKWKTITVAANSWYVGPSGVLFFCAVDERTTRAFGASEWTRVREAPNAA